MSAEFVPESIPDLQVGGGPHRIIEFRSGYRFPLVPGGSSFGIIPSVGDVARSAVVSATELWPDRSDVEPLLLAKHIEIETVGAESGVVWRVPEFDLVVEAEDDVRAESNVREQLILLHEAYADEPDEKLTPGAVALKRRLLETFG